jgi:hypothetical protein
MDTNGVLSKELMLEAGVIRVMVRSTTTAGDLTLTATAKGYKPAVLTATTVACPQKGGFYVDASGRPIEADWAAALPVYLERGETPATPSYRQHYTTVGVKAVEVPVNQDMAMKMFDDNESTDKLGASLWKSDGHLENAWLKVTLERPAAISRITLRMDGFRRTSYPLQVYANGQLVWEGYTDKTLGDCYINIAQPVKTDRYEIRMIGPATVKEAFGSMTELAAKRNVSTKASKSNTLSIIEASFNEAVR